MSIIEKEMLFEDFMRIGFCGGYELLNCWNGKRSIVVVNANKKNSIS